MENTELMHDENTVNEEIKEENKLESCIDHDHITIPIYRFEKLVEAELKLGTVDHDHITIPVARFEKLINAEVTLGMVEQIYRNTASYNLHERLTPIFQPFIKTKVPTNPELVSDIIPEHIGDDNA